MRDERQWRESKLVAEVGGRVLGSGVWIRMDDRMFGALWSVEPEPELNPRADAR